MPESSTTCVENYSQDTAKTTSPEPTTSEVVLSAMRILQAALLAVLASSHIVTAVTEVVVYNDAACADSGAPRDFDTIVGGYSNCISNNNKKMSGKFTQRNSALCTGKSPLRRPLRLDWANSPRLCSLSVHRFCLHYGTDSRSSQYLQARGMALCEYFLRGTFDGSLCATTLSYHTKGVIFAVTPRKKRARGEYSSNVIEAVV